MYTVVVSISALYPCGSVANWELLVPGIISEDHTAYLLA